MGVIILRLDLQTIKKQVLNFHNRRKIKMSLSEKIFKTAKSHLKAYEVLWYIISKEKWYDLCLMTEISKNGPESDKIYLEIKDDQIRYRTCLTPNEEFIVLKKNDFSQNSKFYEELYCKIIEKRLLDVSEKCKIEFLTITSNQSHTKRKEPELAAPMVMNLSFGLELMFKCLVAAENKNNLTEQELLRKMRTHKILDLYNMLGDETKIAMEKIYSILPKNEINLGKLEDIILHQANQVFFDARYPYEKSLNIKLGILKKLYMVAEVMIKIYENQKNSK